MAAKMRLRFFTILACVALMIILQGCFIFRKREKCDCGFGQKKPARECVNGSERRI
jgi:Flp pilus assembly protein TadD